MALPDVRVGHGATSVLERLTKEYLDAHIVRDQRGVTVYTGEWRYVVTYVALRAYNRTEEKR